MTPSARRYLSVAAVAEELGVSTRWVYAEIQAERFPCVRLGHRLVVDRDDLTRYLELKRHTADEAHAKAAEDQAIYR